MLKAEFFQKLAQHKKLSHAYLFSGNNQEEKQGIIEDFLATGNIGLADQMRVTPAEKEISIAQIRQLLEFQSMSAWNSPYKVAVVESAHTMNRESQPAFLKVLEEPKGDTVFFLLTEYPEALLDTIRSRVQEFTFYNFTPIGVAPETQKEFEKLQKASLHERFTYAKKLAESPEEITPTLVLWIALLRQAMVQNAGTAKTYPLAQKIKTIQEVAYILQTSNSNPRLGLERVLLDL